MIPSVTKTLSRIGIIPVVVLEDAAQAVPTARALLAGGIATAEITFRTDAAAQSIARISKEVPELLVGAGTVTSVAMARQAMEAGARYIVSPGLNPEVVRWCQAHELPVLPGVTTPTEIESALALGLDTLKFFPAAAAGGIAMLKALRGPYPGVRFVPTGGISAQNVADYLALPNVLACGGSWMVPKDLLAQGDYAGITALCRKAVDAMLDLRFAHLGINNADEAEAAQVAALFSTLLGATPADNPKSTFVGPHMEVIKFTFRGSKGHIAFYCRDIHRAIYHLAQRGLPANPDSYEYDDQGLRVFYLQQEFGGFAIHFVRA